jgi:nicotinate-nucleotide adenylyltransferase
MKSKKTGLYFGSFNPIHNGHMMIANFLAEFCGLDQVWFVVSPRNPFKQESDLLADYHRREMLIRAVGDYPRFRVSSVEFQLPKPSYTIDTLDYLTKEYPDMDFTVIMGYDQLPKFHEWKESERILTEYHIIVYPRTDPYPSRQASSRFPPEQDQVAHPALEKPPSVTLVNAPLIEVSGTFIRESIRNGKDVRFFMPEQAWKYLDEMNFYRQGPKVNP